MSSVSILVFDNNPNVLQTTLEWLGSKYEIKSTPYYAEAKRILEKNEVDLAILDIYVEGEALGVSLSLISPHIPKIMRSKFGDEDDLRILYQELGESLPPPPQLQVIPKSAGLEKVEEGIAIALASARPITYEDNLRRFAAQGLRLVAPSALIAGGVTAILGIIYKDFTWVGYTTVFSILAAPFARWEIFYRLKGRGHNFTWRQHLPLVALLALLCALEMGTLALILGQFIWLAAVPILVVGSMVAIMQAEPVIGIHPGEVVKNSFNYQIDRWRGRLVTTGMVGLLLIISAIAIALIFRDMRWMIAATALVPLTFLCFGTSPELNA